MFDLVLMAERNALTGDRNLGWFFVVAAVVVFGGLLIAARVLAGKKGDDDDAVPDDNTPGGDDAVEYPRMSESPGDTEPFGAGDDPGAEEAENKDLD